MVNVCGSYCKEVRAYYSLSMAMGDAKKGNNSVRIPFSCLTVECIENRRGQNPENNKT